MTTQTYRRARHSVSLLHAHLVFVAKYRRPVFTNAMLTFCEDTMPTVCTDLDAESVEFNGETDHVHLARRLPTHPRHLNAGAAPQRAHRLRNEARIHRRLCPRPHARTPLVAVVFHRLLRRRTPVHIKQYIDGQARPLRTPGSARRTNRMGLPRTKVRGLRPRIRSSRQSQASCRGSCWVSSPAGSMAGGQERSDPGIRTAQASSVRTIQVATADGRIESSRSMRPPCPGSSVPMSLMPRSRLT